MPPVEFEPTISAGERPQTYTLDRGATGTGMGVTENINTPCVHNSERMNVKTGGTYTYLCALGWYTLVTLPRIVTPYRDSVDGTRDRVTYQKLVTR
jgi:hypothetical protein